MEITEEKGAIEKSLLSLPGFRNNPADLCLNTSGLLPKTTESAHDVKTQPSSSWVPVSYLSSPDSRPTQEEKHQRRE